MKWIVPSKGEAVGELQGTATEQSLQNKELKESMTGCMIQSIRWSQLEKGDLIPSFWAENWPPNDSAKGI